MPRTGISPANSVNDSYRNEAPRTPADVATLVQRAAAILLERKANDVVLLSLDGVSDMTDYFLIASGTSDTHVRSLAQSLAADLKKELRQSPHHEEGVAQGRWALLDYVDFVVHVFHPTLRNFYQLERLWADARSRSGRRCGRDAPGGLSGQRQVCSPGDDATACDLANAVVHIGAAGTGRVQPRRPVCCPQSAGRGIRAGAQAQRPVRPAHKEHGRGGARFRVSPARHRDLDLRRCAGSGARAVLR